MNVFAKAQILGDEDAAGVPCRKVVIDFGKGRTTVWFAVDLGCMPMKWMSVDHETGELIADAAVDRYMVVDTSAGRVGVPLETTYRQEGHGPARKLEHKATIDEPSLRVNEPVDPALFTLVPTQTLRVVDVRKQKERNNHAVENEMQPYTRRVWLVVANVVAIIVLIGLIGRTVLRRRRDAAAF